MVQMRWYVQYLLVFAVLSTLGVRASIGDKSNKFFRCVLSCEQDTCRNHRPVSVNDDTIVQPDPLPWYLVMLGWNCESNCEYHCTHRITNEAQKRVSKIHQQITEEAMRDRTNAILLNEHWQLQVQADQSPDARLADVCGSDKFLSATGECLPRLAMPPPVPMTDLEFRRSIEAKIALEVERLPIIDKRTVQFFGKWPQLRVFGMQEPMSVLFSIANLLVQVYAICRMFPEKLPTTFPLKRVYVANATVASLAWIASTVFHARDLWWTERWDYFSAAAMLMSGLFLAICRIFRIQPGSLVFRRLLMGCVGTWVVHVLYLLSHRRLDYTYNMAACLFVGFVHNILWIVYAHAPQLVLRLREYVRLSFDQGRQAPVKPETASDSKQTQFALPLPARRQLELLVILTFAAPALELFDFPPLFRLLDAHALWHLATVPLTLCWYRWLLEDARQCVMMHAWYLDHHDMNVTDIDELQGTRPHGELPASALALPVSMPHVLAADSMPSTPQMSSALSAQISSMQNLLISLKLWGWNMLRSLRDMFISS